MNKRARWIAVAGASLLAMIWTALPHLRSATSANLASSAAASPTNVLPATINAAARPPVPASTDSGADAGAAALDDPEVQECHRSYSQNVRRHVEQLRVGTPHEQVAAALLMQTWEPAGEDQSDARGKLLESAIRAAPDEPLLAWLYAGYCGAAPCETVAVDHLLQLESDNLAAWLHAMSMAADADRSERAEALLMHAANAKHIDLHWRDTASILRHALRSMPEPQACRRAADRMGVMLKLDRPATMDDMAMVTANATALLPTFSGLSKLCPTTGNIRPDRIAACRSVFQLMAQSDELLPHVIGVRALATHAATAAERAVWIERKRNTAWMLKEGALLLRTKHLPLVWERGEVPVLIALLEDAGRWPAPAGWSPPDPASPAGP